MTMSTSKFAADASVVVSNELAGEIFRDGAHLRGKRVPSLVTLDNRLVAETTNFFAIAALGAFAPYVMVLPKVKISAIPLISETQRNEFHWFVKVLSDALRNSRRTNVVQFEHGMCACAGAGHAHLHLMALSSAVTAHDLEVATREATRYRGGHAGFNLHKESSFGPGEYLERGFELSSSGQHYVYFHSDDIPGCTFMSTAELGSQLGRQICFLAEAPHSKLLSAMIEKNEDRGRVLYKWQQHFFASGIISTMKELAASLPSVVGAGGAEHGYRASLSEPLEVDG